MQDAPALALSGVACTFVDRADPGQRYTAVSDVTLHVAADEFVSVVGPTGCGKSTLLNVAAGLEFRGVPDAKERAKQWLRQVGLGDFGDRYPHQLSRGMRKRTSLARPRDVAEIKTSARFIELHAAIWAVLRHEVLKGCAQQLKVAK